MVFRTQSTSEDTGVTLTAHLFFPELDFVSTDTSNWMTTHV